MCCLKGDLSDYEKLKKAIDKFLAQKKQQAQRLELAKGTGSSSVYKQTRAATTKADKL